MQTSMPVALSAQLAMEKRLNTIADNIANVRTAGFRAEEVKFETFLSKAAQAPVAFASSGETYLSTRTGEMTQTGNTLDTAISGEAWFGIAGANGTVYTRDGRMQMNDQGDLQTLTGRAVLDVGGAPIQLDPNGGPVHIARDGMILQNGQQIGALGLFTMAEGTRLSRAENSGVLPDKPATPLLDFGGVSVLQGYVEGSNVNPVLEITRLIEVQRNFEQAASMVDKTSQSLDSAIAALGAPR